MPRFSILEQILSVERYRQRVSEKRGGYAMPVLGKRAMSPAEGPFLVTNARGRFAATRVSRDGFVNFGFSPSPPDESQDELLLRLYEAARHFSALEGWSTRCSRVSEAIDRLRGSGLSPRSLIIPMATVKEVCGVELQASESGFVTKIEGDVRVYVAPLPEDAALVLPAPETLGLFSRVGDYVGIVMKHANRTLMVVGRDVA